MEELMAIVGAPASAAQTDQILKMLAKNSNVLIAASETVSAGGTQLLHAVATINPDNVAVIAYLLSVQAESLQESVLRPFVERAAAMLLTLGAYTPEAASQLCREEWMKPMLAAVLAVTRRLVDVAHRMGIAHTVILPIARVMDVFCAAPNTLTTFHSAIMEAFVSAGMHERAFRLASSNPIFKIDSGFCASISFDALTYFYYAGLSCLAVKQYEQALSFLMDAIVLPSPRGLSAVVVAAVKKVRIVSMLVSDPVPLELPKYTSYSAMKHFKQASQFYENFRALFDADNVSAIKELLANEANVKLLQEDGNYGLAKLVVKALLKRRVRALIPVFSRMNIGDIVKLKFADTGWSVAQVESLLVEMCASGEISAQIDQVERTVTFPCTELLGVENAAHGASRGAVMLALKERMEDSIQLSNRIRAVQKDLFTNPTFLARKLAAIKRSNGAPDDITQNPMLSEDLIDMVLDHDDAEDMYD